MTYPFPVVNPVSFGPSLHYATAPDGTNIAYSMLGPDEFGNYSVMLLVNYKNEEEWLQAGQTVLYGGNDAVVAYSVLQDGGVLNNPVNLAGVTMTWQQVWDSTEPVYNGQTGSAAFAGLFDLFLSGVTTQQALLDTTHWLNNFIITKLNALADVTINITPVPAAANPTGPIAPLPPAQQVGGIPSGAALFIASNTLLTSEIVAPLAGSPTPWRFQVSAVAPPGAP